MRSSLIRLQKSSFLIFLLNHIDLCTKIHVRLEAMSKMSGIRKLLIIWIHFKLNALYQHIFFIMFCLVLLSCQIWLNEARIRLSHSQVMHKHIFFFVIISKFQSRLVNVVLCDFFCSKQGRNLFSSFFFDIRTHGHLYIKIILDMMMQQNIFVCFYSGF